ncbi:MAG: hypothetical protein ACK5LC_09150 [Coprobacillaceae bacterium]
MINNTEEHPVDMDIMGTAANVYYFLIFVVFVVLCTDLSGHTAKNVISSGISRKTYYLSKLVLSLGLGTVFILFHTYGGYFGNLLINGSGFSSSLYDVTIVMLRQFPVFYGIIAVLVMLSAILQKTAKFNAVAIGMVMGIQLLFMVVGGITGWDLQPIQQFEFNTIIQSMAVVGSVSTQTLVVGVGTGVVMVVGATMIGMQYFKKCTIK